MERRSLTRVDFLDPSFPKQDEFITDPNPFFGGFCTRRAGKSMGAGKRLFRAARKHPGSSVLYIAKTRGSAKNIMWKDVIKVLDKTYKLNCSFNETNLEVTTQEGSKIYLTGTDQSDDELDKLFGQKFSEVIIDEAGAHKRDLRKLVFDVLKPAVADYRGQIGLIGMPTSVAAGLFYDITEGNERGWSVHKWTTFDNPYMAAKWKQEIQELIDMNPLIVNTPGFQQMYLGKWVIDETLLCYRYSAELNSLPQLPNGIPNKPWQYVLGVDLGFDPDPSAFVLCAYQEHDNRLYILETFKKNKMIVHDVADRIRGYLTRFPQMKIVVDAGGQGKQIVEEMRQRHSLPLIAAEKPGKATFIDMMSSDLIMGNIKVISDEGGLVGEWSKLVWDEDSARREENSNCPNHCADAALYAWRYSYNYVHSPYTAPAERGSQAEIDEWERKELEKVEMQLQSEKINSILGVGGDNL